MYPSRQHTAEALIYSPCHAQERGHTLPSETQLPDKLVQAMRVSQG
jgi:hypothetical protein